MNIKVLVVKLTSDKHTVLIMEILKKNKDLKSKFEMKEHNLITNFFPMETKGISCVETFVIWKAGYSYPHNCILFHG